MNEGITRNKYGNMEVDRREGDEGWRWAREIKGGVEERNKARIVDAGVRRTALETPMRRVRESRKKSEAERKRETQERERERENKIERKEFTTRK